MVEAPVKLVVVEVVVVVVVVVVVLGINSHFLGVGCKLHDLER